MPADREFEVPSERKEEAANGPTERAVAPDRDLKGAATGAELSPVGATQDAASRTPPPLSSASGALGIDPASLPTLLLPGDAQEGALFAVKVGEDAARWEAIIAGYERDAQALGDDRRAAVLFLEMGRIWEEHLAKPRNAATAYQRAFNIDPKDPAILHASRRLFTEVGNWTMVVQILDYEVQHADGHEHRATLLAEKGSILEEKLHAEDDAQAVYREALEVWPAEPISISALERLYQSRQEHAALYAIYLRALETTEQKSRRLPLLAAAAHLAEDRLDDSDVAIRHHQEILSLDGHNALALAALRRLLLQTGRWRELVEMLNTSAAATPRREEAGQYLLTASRVLQEHLDETEQALLTMLRALEFVPEDLGTLKEIEFLYEQNQRYDEVVKVLRREAEVTSEARERVPILFKLGGILEDRLGLPDEAILVLEEAVGLMPTYVPAKQALGRLYEKTCRWQALADLFEMEVRLDDEIALRVAKLLKLAEIQERRLQDTGRAVKTLTELLAQKPDYQPARKQLERILQASEDWTRLLWLYEQELSLTEDRDQKIFLLNRIGLLAEDRLQDFNVAWNAFERILAVSPRHLHAIRTLARLATKREAWPELLRIYDLEVEATDDQTEVVAILHRAGVVMEENLGDRDGAIAQYEKVLSLSPTYLPALKSLGRLYHQTARWQDLLAMFSSELEVSRSSEQTIALLFRMADILVDHVGDDARAAQVYHRVLEFDAGNLPALRALAEIYTKTQEHERLVDVLSREAGSLKDAKDRAGTLVRIAETCESKLNRTEQAAEAYQEALRLGYSFDPSIRALVRIYSAEGMWNALFRALRTAYDHATEDNDRVAILLRCAEVAEDKLGDLDGAAESLERALKLQSTNAVVLAQLERISVARRDWRRAIAIGQYLAELETDIRLYAARQIRIATMKETELEPPESGAEQYLLALNRVPNHPVALRALEIAYLRAGNWEGLALFYQREAMVTEAVARRVSLYYRAANVAELRLSNDRFGAAMYDEALKLAPEHVPALRGRRRIAEKLEEPKAVLDCLLAERKVTFDVGHQLELSVEVGRIYQDRFKDTPRAIETYEAVLATAPDNLKAFNCLEGIYIEQGRWADLKRLLELRARSVADEEEQCRLLVSAGQVAQDRMGEIDGAQALYERVLERERMHPTALVRLGPIYFHKEQWDLAIDVFHRTLAVNKEPEVQLDAFKSLGIIFQEHRQDLVKCVQAFLSALQIDDKDVESLRRLSRVYRQAEDFTSAINVLLRLAEAEPLPRSKVTTLLELGALYERVGDSASAILANRKVMELDATNERAMGRLLELYEKSEEWNALAEITASFVQKLAPDRKSLAGPLHLKMADVFEHKLKDAQRAINALRYALDAQPGLVEALHRLAVLYGRSPDTFGQAIEIHRRLLSIDPFRIKSYHEMHQMFLQRKEHDKAFVVAELLVFLRSQAQDEDLYYLEHKSKVASHTEQQLGESDHDAMIVHPDERGAVRALFQVLAAESGKCFEGDLSRYDIARRDRLAAGAPNHLRQLADELAFVLNAPPFDLYLTKAMELGFFLENGSPPALIVGHSVGRRMQDRDLRFMLGRELERLKGGHHILSKLGAEDAAALVAAVARMTPAGAASPESTRMEAMRRQLLRGISSRVKKLLEERIAQHLAGLPVDVPKHLDAIVHTANRAAMAVTNDIEVAVRNIAKSYPDIRPVFRDAQGASETIGQIPEVRALLAYVVSEEYFALRAKLGFSIQS